MNGEIKEYIPVTIWGVGYYIINVYHSRFTESEKAEQYLQIQKFAILSQSPEPHVCIVLSENQKTTIKDRQVIIKTISLERKETLGTPLDTHLLKDKEALIDAVMINNPAYVIGESELIDCHKTIANLIGLFGDGYQLEFLGCCVEER